VRGHEAEERLFQVLTLLVAVCEQAEQELRVIGHSPLPLLNRVTETRDLATDFALSLSAQTARPSEAIQSHD
jgi:hypothetical protein